MRGGKGADEEREGEPEENRVEGFRLEEEDGEGDEDGGEGDGDEDEWFIKRFGMELRGC